MNRTVRLLARTLCVLVMGLLASGCGSSKKVHISGKIMANGKPYQLADKEYFQLAFHRLKTDDTPEKSFPGVVEKDGSFDIPGEKREGIPVGKYRIVLQSTIFAPAGEGQPTKRPGDRFKDALSGTNSPLVQEVTTDDKEFVIDLTPYLPKP